MFMEDTISAIATAIGEGGIGIVRMSGPRAIAVADALFMGKNNRKASNVSSSQIAYGHILDPKTKETVDEVLLLVMRAPHSYTKEDVVEIHCHGGPVPLRKILALSLDCGARLAEPGEFTKRAFLNGRIDLTQAEAVMDIIRAKTDASLKMSVNHLQGDLLRKITLLRDKILEMIAHLEAAIDFPEDDIEEMTANDVKKMVEEELQAVDHLLASAHTGMILREGLQTVIIGKPNVGKSSLLNALLRQKRAIVTDVPGTTRDSIEEYVNIKGVPLKIIDTAGIRDTQDIVEKIGVEKSRELLLQADLVLLMLDVSQPLSVEDRELLSLLAEQKTVIILNKTDLPAVLTAEDLKPLVHDKTILKVSLVEGTGLEKLEEFIISMVYEGQVSLGQEAYVNNVRHVQLLKQAKTSLKEVLKTIDKNMPLDCMVIDLRAAWEQLGQITGDTVGEDIIDEIFSRFCIGK